MTQHKHFILTNTSYSHNYTSTSGGTGPFRSPPRDSRLAHGQKLVDQFNEIKESATSREAIEPNSEGLLFLPLSLEGDVGEFNGVKFSGLDLNKLDSESKGIRIINVRKESDRQIATIAIPKRQLEYFKKKLTDYRDKDDVRQLSNGSVSTKPRNQQLVESISKLHLATLTDYYTDSDDNIPDDNETIWWEVWLELLPTDTELDGFKQAIINAGIELSDKFIRFPEVVVILARGNLNQWINVQSLFSHLAEFRRAKIVPSEFIDLPPSDQAEFIDDLLKRTVYADQSAPAVTLLDTGINRGHPLLGDAITEQDAHAWNVEWTVNDIQGHGTEMAGVALFGVRLKDLLLENEPIQLEHRLESVKILPDIGDNAVPDYGPITTDSMKLVESKSPGRNRVYCMAVTADDRDRHLPTLWSATIDQCVSGIEGSKQRLITISAGNFPLKPSVQYPDENQLASVKDPSQSWNALTIGAYTDLVQLEASDLSGWNPIAPKGLLSPTSTTSLTWSKNWPIKPELVLEGGNFATDGSGNSTNPDDLSILTTCLRPGNNSLLGPFHGTSPAAAQAARMAAVIQANYPEYWPETVRGMLVHNARWTKEMEEEFPALSSAGRRIKIPQNRLRTYGWGIPDLDQSLKCAEHFATLVIQDSIQPYCLGEDGNPKTNEMNFHKLPIPQSKLREIAEEEVEMRVTLSYYIEPSPGRKGWNINHRYASHGLRFDVFRPLESMEMFQKRLSRDFWDTSTDNPQKRERPVKGPDDDRHWAIGEAGQTRGSIHSDFWSGTASQLADSEYIAIYPVTGWWKERPRHEMVCNKARYSLIVTIRTKKTDIGIYNWVANEIDVPVEVKVDR